MLSLRNKITDKITYIVICRAAPDSPECRLGKCHLLYTTRILGLKSYSKKCVNFYNTNFTTKHRRWQNTTIWTQIITKSLKYTNISTINTQKIGLPWISNNIYQKRLQNVDQKLNLLQNNVWSVGKFTQALNILNNGWLGLLWHFTCPPGCTKMFT